MVVGNVLIICFLLYYTMYFANLIRSKNYKNLQRTNVQLDSLRKLPKKTLEEQKEFLNLKYPKRTKNKKTLTWWLNLITMILISIFFALAYNFLFNLFKLNISFWWALLIVAIAPIIINIVLSKYSLDRNNLIDIFKK